MFGFREGRYILPGRFLRKRTREGEFSSCRGFFAVEERELSREESLERDFSEGIAELKEKGK